MPGIRGRGLLPGSPGILWDGGGRGAEHDGVFFLFFSFFFFFSPLRGGAGSGAIFPSAAAAVERSCRLEPGEDLGGNEGGRGLTAVSRGLPAAPRAPAGVPFPRPLFGRGSPRDRAVSCSAAAGRSAPRLPARPRRAAAPPGPALPPGPGESRSPRRPPAGLSRPRPAPPPGGDRAPAVSSPAPRPRSAPGGGAAVGPFVRVPGAARRAARQVRAGGLRRGAGPLDAALTESQAAQGPRGKAGSSPLLRAGEGRNNLGRSFRSDTGCGRQEDLPIGQLFWLPARNELLTQFNVCCLKACFITTLM